MIESAFSYGKGYTKNSLSSNFTMSDASNIATIALLKRFPPQMRPHEGCFCVDCSAILHEQEGHFDAIKTEIEKCMVIAWEEGRKYERE